ncbi:acyl-CoA thioesterase II [Sphingobium sp. SCG-1]|uniref:acyl-CoA thioesterase n=1 Tax=Sphingobium sp. SCG-1 TaxID=2072936 RepID=UPI000CD69B87|nr:acyl-CoA thioesterase II [Sphingobium sp. SCG-1]AUW59685.1 acyl-CoA thioesterase II [Sphingobium sp. SCG-1]
MNRNAGEEAATAAQHVADLLHLLNLEEIDVDLHRGREQTERQGRVFGGQVIAQALAAGIRSASGKVVHSLHSYFMRPGDSSLPITYQIRRDFDGGSFSTRRVTAIQGDHPILVMMISFQRTENGAHHQIAMPDVPPPDDLMSQTDMLAEEGGEMPPGAANFRLLRRPIEFRPCEWHSVLTPTARPPRSASWFRAVSTPGDDPDVHRAVLAYASDMMLLGTCLRPHGVSWATPTLQMASLDHAIWFHETFRVDDWLLYVGESPWAGHARGFNRGQIFTRDGRLVASVAQEGLIRLRDL